MGSPRYLKIVFTPGVIPGKWFSRFDERVSGWRAAGAAADDPLSYVLSGAADIALVRLPGEHWDGGVGGGELAAIADISQKDMDRLGLHRVRLYTEQPGVAVPKEHVLGALDDSDPASLADLETDTLLYRGVNPAQIRENLEVVAANVGYVIAPRPLLRAINQRGVIHRNLDADPGTDIALIWLRDRDDEVIQQFVGVCRGRRAGSSR